MRFFVRFIALVRLLTMIGLIALPFSVWSAPDNTAWAPLISWAKGVTAAEGEFRQVERRGDGSVRTLEGRFAWAPGFRFRWEIVRPFSQVTVSDGQTVTIWDADLRQASLQPLDPATVRSGPLGMLLEPETLPERFILEHSTVRGGESVWVMRPRDESGLIRQVTITLAGDRLQSLVVVDALGQTTELVFPRFVRREPNASAFQITLPPDAVVLRAFEPRAGERRP